MRTANQTRMAAHSNLVVSAKAVRNHHSAGRASANHWSGCHSSQVQAMPPCPGAAVGSFHLECREHYYSERSFLVPVPREHCREEWSSALIQAVHPVPRGRQRPPARQAVYYTRRHTPRLRLPAAWLARSDQESPPPARCCIRSETVQASSRLFVSWHALS